MALLIFGLIFGRDKQSSAIQTDATRAMAATEPVEVEQALPVTAVERLSN